MSKLQNIHQLLAVLGAGVVVGCGAAPVSSNEVPGAMPAEAPAADAPAMPAEAPAAPAAEAPAMPADAAPAAPAPADAPAAAAPAKDAAAPAAMPSHKDMPKGNRTQKVRDSMRAKPCQAGCGAGTCGEC